MIYKRILLKLSGEALMGGRQYGIDPERLSEYAKDIKPNEEVIEDKGVKVLIDPKAIMYLLGTEMDYKKEKFSSQFVFKNPNETERCGCGESFKI